MSNGPVSYVGIDQWVPDADSGSHWKLTNAKCFPSGDQFGTLSLPAPPVTFTSVRILPSLNVEDSERDIFVGRMSSYSLAVTQD